MSKSAICVWDFTLKMDIDNEKGQFDMLMKLLGDKCKKWAFQLEKGESGYLHYQGRVSLKLKARKGFTLEWIHWSITSDENKNNDFYVMKEQTRVKGPWLDTDKVIFIPRHVRDITLFPWQQDILESAKVFDTRGINVLYNKSGNIGKSTLAIYAGCRGLARNIPMMESYKDYMAMVMDCPTSDLYFVDFPRSMNKAGCAGFWSAIESIKNGHAYDSRYSFREKYFDPPCIWIFTNTIPSKEYLTGDRWKYWNVVDNELRVLDLDDNTDGFIGLDKGIRLS